VGAAALAGAAVACAPAPPASSASHFSGPCSELHRWVSHWDGVTDCGFNLVDSLELTPLGKDHILAHRRFAAGWDLSYRVAPDGTVSAAPAGIPQAPGFATAGFTLLPGASPLVLLYQPQATRFDILEYQPEESNYNPLTHDDWPAGLPGGRQLLGLEDGYVLDRSLTDGSMRLWRFAAGDAGAIKLDKTHWMAGAPKLDSAPSDSFRRGHRLAFLGPGRILEWSSSPCPSDGPSPGVACGGATFTVWSYTPDPDLGVTFSVQPAADDTYPLSWPGISAADDIFGDGDRLYVWTRSTGHIRTCRLDPSKPDPLDESLCNEGQALDGLVSASRAPETATAVKHLVLVLQDGRSFDSYFGHTCTGLPSSAAGDPPTCNQGIGCCEGIPPDRAESATCVDPSADPTHVPGSCPDCMRAKMASGEMTQFATVQAACPDGKACGDPADVACTLPGDAPGATGFDQDLENLVKSSAIADRFFQTYAFTDDAPLFSPVTANLLYVAAGRFIRNPGRLTGTPLLTENLATQQVAWAIYAGSDGLKQTVGIPMPAFYDPDWFPFRSLDSGPLATGELENDIRLGELPDVVAVVPNSPANAAPGQPPDAGLAFIGWLRDLVAGSSYRDNTLVLIAYQTAGGFFDHVRPPDPPSTDIDANVNETTGASSQVFYGPRVPLLALPPFGQPGHVAHDPLELSSITAFVEWNWLHSQSLKSGQKVSDQRTFRDTWVHNLRSLIPDIDGVAVPLGPP